MSSTADGRSNHEPALIRDSTTLGHRRASAPVIGAGREFFDSLESLRGVAALLVVLYHMPPWFGPFDRLSFIRHSDLMVNLFFVLSGFVLYHSYQGRIGTRPEFLKFFALRLGRLYPVYLLYLLVFLGIEFTKYVAANKYGATDLRAAPFALNGWGSFVECLFLVQALGFSGHTFAFNFPSWSISTEFYTYVVFAACLSLFAGSRFLFASAAIVLLSILLPIALGHHADTFKWSLQCLLGFFSGCLTYAVFRQFKHTRLSFDWPGLCAFFIFAALTVGSSDRVIVPLSGVFILSLLLTPGSLLNRWLCLRPIRWLGTVSYSLYLSHAFVQWTARQAVRVVLKVPELRVIDVAADPRLSVLGLIIYLVTLLAIMVLAWTTFRFVEVPSRRAIRNLVLGRPNGSEVSA